MSNGHKRVYKKCEICDKEMFVQPGLLLKGKARFCSPRCRCLWKSEEGHVMKKCVVCEKEYDVLKFRVNESHYCSRQCFGVAHKGTNNLKWKGESFTKCLVCDNEFRFRKYPSQNESYGKYCSDKCRYEGKKKSILREKNPNWKGGVSALVELIRSNSKYNQWRGGVFKRDNYTCQLCGYTNGNQLNAHHKIKFSVLMIIYKIKNIDEAFSCDELWDINNGITLCKKCHKIQHKPHK